MPIKGDFISFSYNGVHSTDLGIVHVSSSDRYADALLPTIQDKTVQVSGSDGTYFFGSYYTQRPITLNIAFDSMTETQLRRTRALFGDKQSHPLVFDEEPYKVYYAKVTGTPQYNYICFNNYEDDSNINPRIYKGEGTINFICYDPFAHCPNQYKYLDQWAVNNPNWYKYDNKNEWKYSAGLLSTKGTGNVAYDTFLNGSFKLYNPGDVEADFKLIIPIGASFSGIKVSNNVDLESHTLQFNASEPVVVKGNDTHLLFNSKTNLVEGLKIAGTTVTRSGNLYNEYINSGHWFRIPLNTDGKIWYFTINDYTGDTPTLEYDYLYF